MNQNITVREVENAVFKQHGLVMSMVFSRKLNGNIIDDYSHIMQHGDVYSMQALGQGTIIATVKENKLLIMNNA